MASDRYTGESHCGLSAIVIDTQGGFMSKKEICERVYASIGEEHGLSRKAVTAVFNETLAQITAMVCDEGKCNIVGWGRWKTTMRAARTALHPQTQQKIEIPATTSIKFSAGSEFKEAVKSSENK